MIVIVSPGGVASSACAKRPWSSTPRPPAGTTSSAASTPSSSTFTSWRAVRAVSSRRMSRSISTMSTTRGSSPSGNEPTRARFRQHLGRGRHVARDGARRLADVAGVASERRDSAADGGEDAAQLGAERAQGRDEHGERVVPGGAVRRARRHARRAGLRVPLGEQRGELAGVRLALRLGRGELLLEAHELAGRLVHVGREREASARRPRYSADRRSAPPSARATRARSRAWPGCRGRAAPRPRPCRPCGERRSPVSCRPSDRRSAR